jgi:predicted 3-demethylubiquinone-9 3-methyltransferase (glyoxalase superfamily)
MSTIPNFPQKVTPFLWFNDNAEEAIALYKSLFKHVELTNIQRYGKGMPLPEGKLFTANCTIEGQSFMVMNAGPHYKLNPAFSLVISCENQEEVDHFWDALAQGGEIMQCGWLTDQFGLTWQIIPKVLSSLLYSDDQEKSGRAMQAMFTMKKLIVQDLEDAFNG